MTAPRQPFDGARGLQLPPGLSGARVSLVTLDSRHWFVRKTAASAAASARLRRQAAKQRRFAGLALDVLKTPLILDEREQDGTYSFDMEYIPGSDAASFLGQADYGQVSRFAARLTGYLRNAATAPPLGAPGPAEPLQSVMEAKLAEIQDRTRAIPDDLADSLARTLEKARDVGGVAPTLCHGDLTFENIVVTHSEELYAIDLLDAPIEHYWQDVSKLHQDLAAGWYARSLPAIAPAVLDFLGSALLRTARELDPRYQALHFLLLTVNLLRILPYVTPGPESRFVLERASYFAKRAECAEEC